jgi:hypothetical protein
MPHRPKNDGFGGYFSDSTPDFPPKCRHFGHPFATILHFFGLKKIETLTLSGFYPYSASPILGVFLIAIALLSVEALTPLVLLY